MRKILFGLSFTQRKPEWVMYVILLCGLLFHLALQSEPFDDAYITFRYARNISHGLGFVYNPSQHVLGTTTPLFTLLLSVIALLVDPENLPLVSLFIAIIAETVNTWLIYRIARWAFANPAVAVIAAVMYIFNPFRLVVATKGMEMSLFITFILLIYYRYFQSPRKNTGGLALLMALGWLTRPDAIIAYIPLFTHWLIKDRKIALRALFLAVILTTPWLIWATTYFGSPISQSLVAKSITDRYPIGLAVFFLATFAATGTLGPYINIGLLIPLLVIAVVIAVIGVYNAGKRNPGVLVIITYPILYAFIMGMVNAPMSSAWYYLPLIPGALFLLLSAIWYTQGPGVNVKMATVITAAFFFIAIPAILLRFYPRWTLSNAGAEAYAEACNVIMDEVAPNQVVLAPDIGVLGWCLEKAQILDPVGLVSPEALAPPYTLSIEGFVSLQLIIDKKPAYIVLLDQYLSPQTLGNPVFNRAYTLVWQIPVNKGDRLQSLYIFRRSMEQYTSLPY